MQRKSPPDATVIEPAIMKEKNEIRII